MTNAIETDQLHYRAAKTFRISGLGLKVPV